MIPVKNTDIVMSGNLNGDKIQMGIHPLALQKLIGIVTDLYSDPVGAVIREYSTNAIDSHIAAGQKRPVEVSLPSPLSPYFRVRDFGLGMSVEQVRETYSQYGASTKDNSNDFNGMLGLGSKSALTYTNQFNVIATYNGVRAQIVVSRAQDGTGTMEVVDTVATTDGNGVEIVIPVKYGTEFEQKARKFYSFWKPGTVLVNGKEPSLITGTEVCPGVYTVQGLDDDYIVQGNVAYPVEPGLYSANYYKDFGVVAYVPNGSVSFAPSREALMYDEGTKKVIAKITADFEKGLTASIQQNINESIDHAEALARYAKWKNMMGYSLPQGLTYKTEAIPLRWDLPLTIYKPYESRYQTTHHRQIDYTSLKDAIIVTDYTADGTSQTQKGKLKAYAEENGLDPMRFILVSTASKFGGRWTDAVEVASWNDIKDVRLNKNPKARTGVRGKVSWKVWDVSANWWKSDDNPTVNGSVYYLSPQEKYHDLVFKMVSESEPDAIIVMLGRNRWDKFLREFPNARHISKRPAELVKTYSDLLTDDDKILISMDYTLTENLKVIDEKKVDDPEVVKMVQFAKSGKKNTPGILHYNNMRALGRQVGVHTNEVTVKVSNPLDKYPLFASRRYGNIHPHLYAYMNVAYKEGWS